MLKYDEYLLRLRTVLHDVCGIDALHNSEDFPINLDPSLREYHERIAARIEAVGRSSRSVHNVTVPGTAPILRG